MKITKTASGKQTIKMSKKEWQSIGKKAGWKMAQQNEEAAPLAEPVNIAPPVDNVEQPLVNDGTTDQQEVNFDNMSDTEKDAFLLQLKEGTQGQPLTTPLNEEQKEIMNSVRGQLSPIFKNQKWMQDPKSKAAIFNLLSTLSPQDINKLRNVTKNTQQQTINNLQ